VSYAVSSNRGPIILRNSAATPSSTSRFFSRSARRRNLGILGSVHINADLAAASTLVAHEQLVAVVNKLARISRAKTRNI
jgi:hypothetical protein